MSLPTFKVHAWGRRLAIFAAVFLVIYYGRLWQPRRQIELHQQNLLTAIEDRNWRRLNAQFAENYSDRFGYNRETAIADIREVMRHFFAASLRPQLTRIEMQPDAATVTTNLTLSGTGSAATEWISGEVNQLRTPWVFSWRKASFLPWDWRLEKVENPSLDVAGRRSSF